MTAKNPSSSSSEVLSMSPDGLVKAVHGIPLADAWGNPGFWIARPLFSLEATHAIGVDSPSPASIDQASLDLAKAASMNLSQELAEPGVSLEVDQRLSLLACLSPQGWKELKNQLAESYNMAHLDTFIRYAVLRVPFQEWVSEEWETFQSEALEDGIGSNGVLHEDMKQLLKLDAFQEVYLDIKLSCQKAPHAQWQTQLMTDGLTYLDEQVRNWGGWFHLHEEQLSKLLQGYLMTSPYQDSTDALHEVWRTIAKQPLPEDPQDGAAWRQVLTSGLKSYEDVVCHESHDTGLKKVLGILEEACDRWKQGEFSSEEDPRLRILWSCSPIANAVCIGPLWPSWVWRESLNINGVKSVYRGWSQHPDSISFRMATSNARGLLESFSAIGVHWALWMSEVAYVEQVRQDPSKIHELFQGVKSWLEDAPIILALEPRCQDLSPREREAFPRLAQHVEHMFKKTMTYVTRDQELLKAWGEVPDKSSSLRARRRF